MKHKLLAFSDSLIKDDYIFFGAIVFIFFLLILTALLLRKKVGLSIFLVIFSFVFLIVSPFVGYPTLHNYLYKNELTLVSQNKLQFTKAVVVLGTLKNTSKRNFQACKITAIVNKHTSNKYKNYIYTFKPIMKMSIIEEDIVIDNEIDFKIIVEPFTYSKDYNITLEADCR